MPEINKLRHPSDPVPAVIFFERTWEVPVIPILRAEQSGARVSAAFLAPKNYCFSGVSLAPAGKAQQQLQENQGRRSCQRELGNTTPGSTRVPEHCRDPGEREGGSNPGVKVE